MVQEKTRENTFNMEPEVIQKRLNDLGYGPLIVDGILGPKSLAALKAFLSDRGLSYPATPTVIENAFEAGEVENPVKLTTLPIPLNPDQYYAQAFQKKFIFLHHTAGGNVSGAIQWWNSKPDHVSTAYIIGRDGKTYQCFDPKYWAYALGLKGGTAIERASIQIELVAWGKLSKRGDKFYSSTGEVVPAKDVITFKDMYRDCYFYQSYTPEQLLSLKVLLVKLVKQFGIKVQPLTNFWYYNKDWLSNPKPGIWSHSTVRKDKSDIMPQKELITLLYSLNFSEY